MLKNDDTHYPSGSDLLLSRITVAKANLKQKILQRQLKEEAQKNEKRKKMEEGSTA